MVTIQFKKLTSTAKIPTFANEGDAGMDFYSDERLVIRQGSRVSIRTGVSMQFKFGILEKLGRTLLGTKYVLDGRCKSGRALKEGFTLTNGVGTIDEGYRGMIMCIVTNTGDEPIVIECGQKIFQGVVQKLPRVIIGETYVLNGSDRGEDGFGSSGLQ